MEEDIKRLAMDIFKQQIEKQSGDQGVQKLPPGVKAWIAKSSIETALVFFDATATAAAKRASEPVE